MLAGSALPKVSIKEDLEAARVVSERHLDHILHVAQDWYNHRRGHTERDHLPPVRDDGEPSVVGLAKHRIECHCELGGHLRSYRRVA